MWVEFPLSSVYTRWVFNLSMLLLPCLVMSQYPMCTERGDDWLTIGMYPYGQAVDACGDACTANSSLTFSNVRRQGSVASYAECHCSDTRPKTSVSGCNYTCGGSICGGAGGKHSVYPVCPTGNYGQSCGYSCPGDCSDGVCQRISGECAAGCLSGFHGNLCNKTCGNCASVTCRQSDAACEGDCVDGWYTLQCTEPCSEHCQGPTNACEQIAGECTEGCEAGWYTPQCIAPCPGYCKLTSCTLEYGLCKDGCNDGYHGVRCEGSCPTNCLEAGCIQGSGECYSCNPGTYGDICDQACSTNCSDAGCTQESGLCYSCRPGSSGELCEEACPANCADKVCDMENGTCAHGCQPGWTGVTCETVTGSDSLSTAAIIGICFALAVVVAGLVVFIVFFVCKRDQSSKSEADGVTNPAFDISTGEVTGVNGRQPNTLDVPAKSRHLAELPKVTRPPWNRPPSGDRPMEINRFPECVAALTKPAHTLTEEYENLPSEQLYDWEASRRDEVKGKNKFKGIYPYDSNRVVLDTVEGSHVTDYINASIIQGYNPEGGFIATLGPREKTVEDFWRMIWQERASTIVMLTNLVESGVVKCDQYWPPDSEQTYGDLRLTIVAEDMWPSHIVRKFRISKGDTARRVTQHHFTCWPDHGVPSDATALLDFRRKLLRNSPPNLPVVVHCSAGVGRTGTLIAIDYLIKQAEAEGAVDVYNCVLNLRHQRIGMVQSVDQYKFIHEALLEYLRVGTTTVSIGAFTAKYMEAVESYPGGMLARQYTILNELAPSLSSYDRGHSLSTSNRDKNRFPDIIPPMLSRVYLRSQIKDRNDYINAVSVNGFKTRDAYHVTQFPLENTVVDFWRMMQDYESTVLVVLQTKEQSHETSHFLPAKNRPMDVLDGVASVRSSISSGSYRKIDLFLGEKTKDDTQYMNIEDVSKDANGRHVIVYEITIIPDQEYQDYDVIAEVYRIIQQRSDTCPVTVTCLNGATYSGQFVACCNLFEMIESEQEIDVFQVTKYIRDSRPEFIGSLEQYRGLYEAVRTYLIQYDTYANC